MLLIKQKRLAETGRTDLWLPGGGREEKNQEFGVTQIQATICEENE